MEGEKFVGALPMDTETTKTDWQVVFICLHTHRDTYMSHTAWRNQACINMEALSLLAAGRYYVCYH